MTPEMHPHEMLLQELQKEFADILDRSTQGVYIYLDDPHWICNKRMASLLGYGSPDEVIKLSRSAPLLDALVIPEDHNRLVEGYENAVNNKAASMIPVTWKKKGGGTLRTQTLVVPISFKGTVLALHFIKPV